MRSGLVDQFHILFPERKWYENVRNDLVIAKIGLFEIVGNVFKVKY